MYEMRFEAVKELIVAKKYYEARVILKTIDHPKARQWEAQLNKLDQSFSPALAPAAKSIYKRKSLRRDAAIFFGLILFCFLLANMYEGLISRPRAASIKGTEYAFAMQTATVHKLLIKQSQTPAPSAPPLVIHLDPVGISGCELVSGSVFSLCSTATEIGTFRGSDTPVPTPTEIPATSITPKVLYAKDHAELRRCPYISCEDVEALPYGTPIHVNSTVDGDNVSGIREWYPVEQNGRTLYAHSLDFNAVPPDPMGTLRAATAIALTRTPRP